MTFLWRNCDINIGNTSMKWGNEKLKKNIKAGYSNVRHIWLRGACFYYHRLTLFPALVSSK